MKLTKSSIKADDLVALLENLRDFQYLSEKHQQIFNIIPDSEKLVRVLDPEYGTFGEKQFSGYFQNKIYRLYSDTTLKQLKEACFPTKVIVEPRFLEMEGKNG